jgi:hypothetical protein
MAVNSVTVIGSEFYVGHDRAFQGPRLPLPSFASYSRVVSRGYSLACLHPNVPASEERLVLRELLWAVSAYQPTPPKLQHIHR